jgi:hypothetical protein
VHRQVTKWVLRYFWSRRCSVSSRLVTKLELNRVVSVAAAVVAFSKKYETRKLRSYC